MKRIVTTGILFLLLLSCLFAGEEEILQQARKFMEQKEFEKALEVIDEGMKTTGPSMKLMQTKYSILLALKRLDEAMAILDIGIQFTGESVELLQEKFRLLTKMERYDEALKIGLKVEEKFKLKSPWTSLEMALVYLKKNDRENALDWLEKAASRGFISYNYLYSDDFKSLQNEERLSRIIDSIKDKIGIGKEAEDFNVELLSGETFVLSEQRGKVVLIDFWATWCGPCRREMPNLKEAYKEYHDKGLEIVGISLDTNKESLDKYIEKEKISWKISFSGSGWKDDTARKYGVNSIPSYWLVDKKGILRHLGLRGKRLIEAIVELIAE